MSEHEHRPEADSGDQERQVPVRLVVFLVVALLVVLLGVDNRHDVQVNYLVGDSEFALVWVIIVSLAAGAVLDRTWAFIRTRRSRNDD